METEEGEKLTRPGPFVLTYDPHAGLPPWAFLQVGALFEVVARADLTNVVSTVHVNPRPRVLEAEFEQTSAVEVPSFSNIPEVNIPWKDPEKFFEQFVTPGVIEVSQGVQSGLGRVIELASTYIETVITADSLNRQSGVESSQGLNLVSVGENLYAEALKQVQKQLTLDDVLEVEQDKPAWYWAGLAAATIALFSRAVQSGITGSFDSQPRQQRQQAVESTRPPPRQTTTAPRGGGGGGHFVNVAEIIRETFQSLPRTPSGATLARREAQAEEIRRLRVEPTPERMQEIIESLAPGTGIGFESSARIRIV